MYAKPIFKNAKRSVKDYLIYIVTMTLCVTLFYAFLSISSTHYHPTIGAEYNISLRSRFHFTVIEVNQVRAPLGMLFFCQQRSIRSHVYYVSITFQDAVLYDISMFLLLP